jgi:hypothetical protein
MPYRTWDLIYKKYLKLRQKCVPKCPTDLKKKFKKEIMFKSNSWYSVLWKRLSI